MNITAHQILVFLVILLGSRVALGIAIGSGVVRLRVDMPKRTPGAQWFITICRVILLLAICRALGWL